MLITNEINLDIHKRIEQLELTEFSRDFVSTYEQTYSWQKKNKNTLLYILDNDVLLWHMSFLPIDKDTFNIIKSWIEIDTEIPETEILEEEIKEIYLYFCVVFIDKKYRWKWLWLEMFKIYKTIFKDYQILWVVSDAISKSWEDFCKKIWLEFYKDSNHNSKIYIWNL